MGNDGKVRLVRVTSAEALSAVLAEVGIHAAAETLRGGGYARPTDAQFAEIARMVTQGALAIPLLVEDMAVANDEQLEEAARYLGTEVARAVVGPPPMVQ